MGARVCVCVCFASHCIGAARRVSQYRVRVRVCVRVSQVGFEVLFDKDLALETEGTRPWYHKLDMSYISTRMTHYFTWFMETVGLAPAGSLATHTMLLHAVDGLVAGGKTGTFTPMHLIVMKKPEKAAAPAPAPAPAKPVAPAPAPAPAAAKPAAPAPAPAKAAPAPAPAKPAAAGKV